MCVWGGGGGGVNPCVCVGGGGGCKNTQTSVCVGGWGGGGLKTHPKYTHHLFQRAVMSAAGR